MLAAASKRRLPRLLAASSATMATNVAAVHSRWAKHRPLLAARPFLPQHANNEQEQEEVQELKKELYCS